MIPFLLIYMTIFTVVIESSANITYIKVGAVFPPYDISGNYTDEISILGMVYRTMISLAVSEINNGTIGILNLTSPVLPPNLFQLDVLFRDDTLSQKDALINTMDLCQIQKVSAIIGATYSSISEIMNLAASSYNVPQISGSSTNALLSNKDVYSTFMRTCFSDALQGIASAQIIYDFGWRFIATITSDDSYASGLIQSIESECTSRGIQVLASKTFPAVSSSNPSPQVDDLLISIKNSGARIIALGGYVPDAQWIMTRALYLGMAGLGTSYVWIGNDGWLQKSLLYKQGGNQELDAVVNKALVGVIGTTPDNGLGSYENTQLVSRIKSSSLVKSMSYDPSLIMTDAYYATFYDAVYVLAKGLAMTINQGHDVNKDSSILYANMKAVQFMGASGYVSFNEITGDRDGRYQLLNLQGSSLGSHFLQFKVIGEITKNTSPSSEGIIWASGNNIIPSDVQVFSIPSGIQYSVIIMGSLGMMHSLSYIPWLILKWKTPVIVASTPVFMLMILMGGVIGNIGVILRSAEFECGVFNLLIRTCGVTIILTCVIIKSYRVVQIFKNRLKFVVIHLRSLVLYVFLFLLYDIITFMIWDILDPLRMRVVQSNLSVYYTCASNGSYWMYIILLPKVLLLLKGIDIAYNMKNVVSAFNETRIIGNIIYNIAFSSIVSGPLYILSSDAASQWLIDSFYFLWVINTSIAVLFISKLYFCFKHGYDGGFNEADIVSSRRDSAVLPSGGSDGSMLVNNNFNLLKENEHLKVELRTVQTKLKNSEFNCERLIRGETMLSEAEAALFQMKAKRHTQNNALSPGNEE